MAFPLSSSPANRAYEVFNSLFASEEDRAAWMWKFKHCIVADCEFDDGADGGTRQYIDVIETRHQNTGLMTSLDEKPSRITVYGIGTYQERAVIEWLSYPNDFSGELSQMQPTVEKLYDVTREDYRRWASANGILTRMPIMKT